MVQFILPSGREVVLLLDLVWPNALCDSDHPEELVDIISRVSEQSTENDKDVFHVVLSKDGVSLLLGGAHDLANSSDMG